MARFVKYCKSFVLLVLSILVFELKTTYVLIRMDRLTSSLLDHKFNDH